MGSFDDLKVYKTNWVPYSVMLGLSGLLLIGSVLPDISSPTAFLDGIFWLLFLFGGITFAIACLTHVSISHQKIKNVDFYHRRTFSIHNITKIDRAPLYRGFGWGFGYQLFVYFTRDDDGTLDYTHINLNHYKKETTADLLKTLLEINPNIKLDKATEKLLKTGK